MKKILIIAILAAAAAITANAQPRAIGVRLGYGAEVSYEHSLGKNMLQIEAGVPGFASFEAACTYNWVNPFRTSIPWNEKGEWNWYLGAGAVAGCAFAPVGFVGAAGRVGIEYRFWFPMEISLDFRPTFGAAFGANVAAFYWDVYAGGLGLAVRYCF